MILWNCQIRLLRIGHPTNVWYILVLLYAYIFLRSMTISPLVDSIKVSASVLKSPAIGGVWGLVIWRYPLQGRVTGAHETLPQVIPAVYEMFRRYIVEISISCVPISRVCHVLNAQAAG